MRYYINDKEVRRSQAKEYVEKLWGKGKFEEREQEARDYFRDECDSRCSWADGFAIEY